VRSHQRREDLFVVPVKIRLMRVGKKKQPTYRVVAADERSPRDGRYIEILGQYEPRSEPSKFVVNDEKVLGWLRQGAQPSDQVHRLLVSSGLWEQYESGRSAQSEAVRKAKARARGSAAAKERADAAAAQQAETEKAEAAAAAEAAPEAEAGTSAEDSSAEAEGAEAPVDESAAEEDAG
jgi:small subunit ribosomal protein S16